MSRAKAAAVAVAVAACIHHWLCEPPNGPTSRAVCRLCGAEREFRNAAVTDYGGDGAAWNGVTCAHCGRAFGSRGAMVSHTRAAHQGVPA